MKTKLILIAAAIALLSTLDSTSFAQGALTPPGAPAPTMKSLDQIEARTAITNTSSLVTISQPGSYYLTHNITVSAGDGIDINTNGVTLDLNGFTLISTAGSATTYAIYLASGLRNVTIQNGAIQGGVTNNAGVYGGGGFQYGIYGLLLTNVTVSKVSVSGIQVDAIHLGLGKATAVAGCTVTTAGSYGILASAVKDSVATDCGGTAISGDLVMDCEGSGNQGIIASYTALNCYGNSSSASGTTYGISAKTALNSYGQANGGYGIQASLAQNCYGYSNSYFGLDATIAQNSYGFSSTYYGLYAIIAQNCMGYAQGSGTGLYGSYVSSCYGSSNTGTGLSAYYGDFSFGYSNYGTAVSVTTKYNMP